MRFGLFLAILLTLSSTCASAQDPVHWSASGPASPVAHGQKFTARVSARIDPGWHIYSITQAPGGPVATEINLARKQAFNLAGPIIGPLPRSAYDSNFQLQTEFYEQTASFKVPLTAAANAPAGPTAVAIDVRFQVCNERQCLPATTVHLKAPVRIASGGTKPK
jgi:thiol:disulfide interchange protein DsbD